MSQFKVTFLDSYSADALLDELRRVVELHGSGPFTRKKFNELSGKVSARTIQRKLGGWESALLKIGAGHLYAGPKVTEKLKNQRGRRLTNDQLLEELRRVHKIVGTETVKTEDFDRLCSVASSQAIASRFRGWAKALEKAGITFSSKQRRYTDSQLLENLLSMWTHYGRQPSFREMNLPPSKAGPWAYLDRWGGWRKSVKAFVEWANSDEPTESEATLEPQAALPQRVKRAPEDRHDIPPRLRWKVVVRDRFRCVVCGRSPASDLSVELHVDHKTPWADGGKTVLDNLQTLCRECNLGKGKSFASIG